MPSTGRAIYIFIISALWNLHVYIQDSNPKSDYKFYIKFFVSFTCKFVQT